MSPLVVGGSGPTTRSKGRRLEPIEEKTATPSVAWGGFTQEKSGSSGKEKEICRHGAGVYNERPMRLHSARKRETHER